MYILDGLAAENIGRLAVASSKAQAPVRHLAPDMDIVRFGTLSLNANRHAAYFSYKTALFHSFINISSLQQF